MRDPVEDGAHGSRPITERLAAETSRRGFLSRVGKGLLALTGSGLIAGAFSPEDSDAYHFCGHTYTTGSCPHPTGLPRIDSHGRPLRARDGVPIDNLGRPVNRRGEPLDEDGNLLRDLDGHPLAPAPRTPVCEEAGRRFGFSSQLDGSWYRCCGGRVRKLMDCCAYSNSRINGDAALTGYCYSGRKVFCVMYHQTNVPC
jgi:hypothetical protein